MTERQLDWRKFLNRLMYCYGCGRFGLPRGNPPMPRGWGTLYQPHANAPPGLHYCREGCKEKLRVAMQEGPVLEPLEMASNVMMDSEMRDKMMVEAMEFAALEEGRLDELFDKVRLEVVSDQGDDDG